MAKPDEPGPKSVPGPRGEWRIPADAAPYKHTPAFDEHSTPAALRRAHDTKAGVWGEIVVASGCLRFHDLRADRVLELRRGRHGVVEPQAPHRVEPEPGTRFWVVFHRAADG